MPISQDIKNLIYEFADISNQISDAITPSGLGKAASVAKKVAGAAQESDTAKHTKKILDDMDAARNASGPKTAGNMSPGEFSKMLDQREAASKATSKAAKAVHNVASNTDHKPHMLAAKWATDEKGLVKGTRLTPDQYTAHRIKHGGIPNPAAHHAETPVKPKYVESSMAGSSKPGPSEYTDKQNTKHVNLDKVDKIRMATNDKAREDFDKSGSTDYVARQKLAAQAAQLRQKGISRNLYQAQQSIKSKLGF